MIQVTRYAIKFNNIFIFSMLLLPQVIITKDTTEAEQNGCKLVTELNAQDLIQIFKKEKEEAEMGAKTAADYLEKDAPPMVNERVQKCKETKDKLAQQLCYNDIDIINLGLKNLKAEQNKARQASKFFEKRIAELENKQDVDINSQEWEPTALVNTLGMVAETSNDLARMILNYKLFSKNPRAYLDFVKITLNDVQSDVDHYKAMVAIWEQRLKIEEKMQKAEAKN